MMCRQILNMFFSFLDILVDTIRENEEKFELERCHRSKETYANINSILMKRDPSELHLYVMLHCKLKTGKGIEFGIHFRWAFVNYCSSFRFCTCPSIFNYYTRETPSLWRRLLKMAISWILKLKTSQYPSISGIFVSISLFCWISTHSQTFRSFNQTISWR
jgi:hypothetical protein